MICMFEITIHAHAQQSSMRTPTKFGTLCETSIVVPFPVEWIVFIFSVTVIMAGV